MKGKRLVRITVILIGIFDEMKHLKNDMKKTTSESRELRKLVGAWEISGGTRKGKVS